MAVDRELSKLSIMSGYHFNFTWRNSRVSLEYHITLKKAILYKPYHISV